MIIDHIFNEREQGLGNIETNVRVSAESQGLGIARGIAAVADTAEYISKRAQQIQDEDDATRALEARNAAEEAIRELQYGENGFYGKSGRDAVDGYKEAQDEANRIYSETGQSLSEGAKLAYESLIQRDKNVLFDNFARHTSRERAVYRAQVKDAAVSNALDVADTEYANGQSTSHALETGRVAIVASMSGAPEEAIAEELEKFESDFHVRAIQAAADADDYAVAKALFDANGGKIEGRNRQVVKSYVEASGLKERAIGKVDSIFAKYGTFKERIEAARAIKDPELHDEVVRRVKTRQSEEEAYAKGNESALMQQAEDLFEQGVPTDQWPISLVVGLESRVVSEYRRREEGGEIETDWETWAGLAEMTPNELVETDPMQIRQRLGDTEFKSYIEDRQKALNGEAVNRTNFRTFNQKIDDALRVASIKPTAEGKQGERAQQMRRRAQDMLYDLEEREGRKSTPDEQDAIVDELMLEIAIGRDWFWQDKTSRVFEVDVPDSDRLKIIDALDRKGIPVTERAIAELYVEGQRNGDD